MSRYKPDNRTAFSRQPAHYLLFDVGHPLTSTQMRNTIMAVQNVLVLSCSIRGGCRIPAFGLAMINKNFQNMYSLDTIRGNFSKIVAAFNSLSYQAKLSERLSLQEFKDYLYLAIKTLLEDFKSKSEIMSGNNKWQFPPQLQITLVTAKNGSSVQQCLEDVVNSINISKLKKIQIVQLQNLLGNLATENNMEEKPEQKVNTDFLKAVEFVVLIQVAGTEKELDSLFKTWLLDCDIDHEHLRIALPETLDPLGSVSSLLKCDIGECLINPFSLPFGHRYQIQMDFCSIQLGGSALTKSAANDMPVYELEVLGCLSSSSICQSQLFGQPAHIYPTQCWHLEWEELLSNQQLFIALCKALYERDQYLLTRLKGPTHSISELAGYFVLESDGSELLLNAAVSAELVLPTREVALPCLSDDTTAQKMFNAVSNCLDQLPLMQEFQPSNFPSGLYSILARNLQHNTLHDNTYFLNGSSNCEMGNSSHPALDVSPHEPQTRGGSKRNRGSNSSSKRSVQSHHLKMLQ